MMRLPLAALGLALLSVPARAHVTLDQSELPADGYVRVALRVGHGCQGAATTAIRVAVPADLPMARPMPHAGWTLTLGGGGGAGGGVQGAAAHGGHDAAAPAAGDVAAHAAEDAAAHGANAGHAHHAAPTSAPIPARREIAWTGGRLDDALYDEFVLFLRTPPTPGATLILPVLQECEGGKVSRWTEAPPAPGARAANPAPFARLVPGR